VRFVTGRTKLVLVLLAVIPCGSPAGAASEQSGVGSHFRYAATVKHVTLFEPLSVHGSDAIRVTVDHGGNRSGWTIELYPEGPDRRVPLRHAAGAAAVYIASERPVFVTGWERLALSRNDYDQVAAHVDAALSRREPWPQSSDLVVGCGEPRILVERRKHGRTTWLEQECGASKAGEQIVGILIKRFPFPLCWYLYTAAFTEPCRAVRPPGLEGSDDQPSPSPMLDPNQ